MKSTREFLSRLLPRVPGCPEPLALMAIADSAIAFCERSEVIREEIDAFTTAAGVSNYTLDVVGRQQPARVLSASVDNAPLTITSAVSSGLAPDTTDAKPRFLFSSRTNSDFEVVLYPTPDAAYTVRVFAALRPVPNADYLEDDLYDLWLAPVVDGALAQLMFMPGQSFTNYPLAEMYSRSALAGANKAKIESTFGRVLATNRVQARPFA